MYSVYMATIASARAHAFTAAAYTGWFRYSGQVGSARRSARIASARGASMRSDRIPCVTAAVLPGSNGAQEYPMSDQPPPLFGLDDVTAHLEALFLIAEADEAHVSTGLEERLDMLLGRQDLDLRAVIRYLAGYAAALCRTATHHTPDKPGPGAQELIAEVSRIVSLSVPRPE